MREDKREDKRMDEGKSMSNSMSEDCADGAEKKKQKSVLAPLSAMELAKEFLLPVVNPMAAASKSLSCPSPSSSLPSPLPSPSKCELALSVMCGRVIVNLVATPAGAKYLTEPERVSFFLSVAASMVENKETLFLQPGGVCIIHNIALLMGEEKSSNQALYEIAIPALAAAIRREFVRLCEEEQKMKTAFGASELPEKYFDTLQMMLKALGVCCLNNVVGVGVVCSLQGDAAVIEALTSMKDFHHWKKIQPFAAELFLIVTNYF